jgi:hypothetical protein
MLFARRLALQQPTRAFQPTCADGELAPKRPVVPREPHRHTCGAAVVAGIPIQLVRALTGIEHDAGIVQPPCGEPESFESFGALGGGTCLFVRVERFAPLATAECIVAMRDQIVVSNIVDRKRRR